MCYYHMCLNNNTFNIVYKHSVYKCWCEDKRSQQNQTILFGFIRLFFNCQLSNIVLIHYKTDGLTF